METTIKFKTGRIKWHLALGDILYCKAETNYTTFYMKDGSKVLTSKTLKIFDGILSPSHFFRIHSGYLVNLAQIAGVIKKPMPFVQLKNGIMLPISFRKKIAFTELIKQQVLFVA